jgi:ferric-dicitrate binding protein FerR (iron transport regulator)
MSKKIEDLLTDQSFRRFVLNPRQGDFAAWDDWVNSSDENKRLYQEAMQLIVDFYQPLSSEEFESQSIEFNRRIKLTESEHKDIISLYDQRHSRRPVLMKYVAVILFLVISVFAITVYNSGLFLPDEEIDLTSTMLEKSTTTGQKMTMVFPDGTVVKLNSESSISFPEEFSRDSREVTLSGEAYFDVAHYEEWPFIVKTKEVETVVLGTEFNITSYPEVGNVEIALVNGRVNVRTKDKQTIVLEPMKMASIGSTQQNIKVSDFDFLTVTGWKDNIIVFEKASFLEIQSTLERWYGVKFEYDDMPRFEGGYTGDFTDESLQTILNGISSNKFDFKIEGKRVFITKTTEL